MSDLSRDPLVNAVCNGIKKGIEATYQSGCIGSCLILIYSGIDTMAFLDMPENQPKVTRLDFIRWAERYIRFPCKEQLTGADLYGARCAMVHQYGIDSDMSRGGECRRIGYMDKGVPEIKFNPEIAKDLVVVSVEALKKAFSDGVDQFLVQAFADRAKASIVEKRLHELLQAFPYKRPS